MPRIQIKPKELLDDPSLVYVARMARQFVASGSSLEGSIMEQFVLWLALRRKHECTIANVREIFKRLKEDDEYVGKRSRKKAQQKGGQTKDHGQAGGA